MSESYVNLLYEYSYFFGDWEAEVLVVEFIVDKFPLLEGDTVLEELLVEVEFEELDALLTVEELVELVFVG